MSAPVVSAREMAPFDVCGPLPAGTTVLEASAGTGKTFTIAALATRYVAEGVTELSRLMLVTFTRAATAELRERVRQRLVAAERGLADPRRARGQSEDSLLHLLASVDDREVAARRRRLAAALAGFDAATIATQHEFASHMLAGLGMAGDTEPGATLVERLDDLVQEVVDDLYLRKYGHPQADKPALSARDARAVGLRAVRDPQAVLVGPEEGANDEVLQRYGMAHAVRQEVAARKRSRRLLDYDDLLTLLRDALRDPQRGEFARERIRSRYDVVLVDEFQDTDPVQWEILRLAFSGARTLVLIGDPKQAIYAFRGGDLVTYLSAAGAADDKRTLARNYRSDEPLLGALHQVFREAALGDERIVVRAVDAEHRRARLTGSAAPLRLRVMRREQGPLTDRDQLLRVAPARALVAQDLAGDVVQLLSGSARLALDGDPRPVRPGDLAVLVRKNDQALLVQEALSQVGVPAVLAGAKSVFLTRMARQWLTFLRALEQPHRAGLVRAAALTCFLGWTARDVATAGDDATDALSERMRLWRDTLATRGVAALTEVVLASTALVERLLGTPSGERDLTDLRHIAQALHAAAVEGQLGPAALVEWLQRRIAETDDDGDDERTRRLETDAAAVQVVTVHSAKGLEFPIVYVPFAWDRHLKASPDPLRLHDGETRLLDVGGSRAPGYSRRAKQHKAEEAGEELRLLYVALTRAQCGVVTWWAPSYNTAGAPLHRLLFGDAEPGAEPPATVRVPVDARARERLEQLVARAGRTIALEDVSATPSLAWSPPPEPPAELDAARFERGLDTAWRRTSYSALTAGVHDVPGVASEPEAPEREDEIAVQSLPLPPPATLDEELVRAVPSPMAGLPTGAAFGTVVHSVLEQLDTAADDLGAQLRLRCEQEVQRRLGSTLSPEALAAGLLPALDTPLGPLAGGLRLRDVHPVDRLAEVSFELPLAGGDEARSAAGTVADIAAAVRRRLPKRDPLRRYATALDVPALHVERLRGYLTGSIDAVLRVRNDAGEPRYLVVDYKTNWLGSFGPGGAEPLTAWDYRPAALTDAMIAAHYPLQALLYCVALHRFLRWRQPGYDPAQHLGGVLYLFVRGMCGATTPVIDGVPCGVFSWQPPAALVEDLSTLLDRGKR